MDDVRPTARWANRMLRPLTAIYHRLEKHQEIAPIHGPASRQLGKSSVHRSKQAISSRRADSEDLWPDPDPNTNDPAWLPGRRIRRRIRHRYSTQHGEIQNGGRRRNRVSLSNLEAPAVLPGAIEIATPLITGKSYNAIRHSDEGLFEASPSSREGLSFDIERKVARAKDNSLLTYRGSWKEALDLSGDAGLIDIARFLDQIFLKFLNNTSLDMAPSRRRLGARSLLSVAVGMLPQFIAEEQELQDGEDDECDIDMCDVYFTELEAQYAPSGNGWPPLREAARSQGIYLVSEMLQRNWITGLLAYRLLEQCLNHSHFDAFELLMRAHLSTVKFYDYPASFDELHPPQSPHGSVKLLYRYFSASPAHRNFSFNALATLLSRQALPPEWMVAYPWKKVTEAAILSLSRQDQCSVGATVLIQAVILAASDCYPSIADMCRSTSKAKLCTDRCKGIRASAATYSQEDRFEHCPVPIQDALSNLILSLVAVLCGMFIVRSRPQSNSVDKPVRNIIGSLVPSLRQSIRMNPSLSTAAGSALQSLRRGYVLLGYYVLLCFEHTPQQHATQQNGILSESTEAFLLHLASQSGVMKELATLVRQIIHCYERVNKGVDRRAHHIVRRKVSQLLQIPTSTGLSNFLGRVAVEVAMELAETTSEPDDHLWAMEIQERFASSQRRLHTTSNRSARLHSTAAESAGLYRWEDSISEWVLRTPDGKPKEIRVAVYSKRSMPSKPPRVIACSTGSCSDSSSDCSVYSGSSPTSSYRASPQKRASPVIELLPRPSKRHRYEALRGTDRSRPAVDDPSTLRLVGTSHHARSTSQRGRRTFERPALREMRHDPNGSNRSNATTKPTPTPRAKLEVVIVNKKEGFSDQPGVATDHPYPTSHGGIVQQPAFSVQRAVKRPETRVSCVRRPTRATIPCSEDDDSDDELSFL